MRLEFKKSYSLLPEEPNHLVVPITVDVIGTVNLDEVREGEAEEYVVGRILADELNRFEIEEWGYDVHEAADADSSGLEAAWSALLDDVGNFPEDEYEGHDPVVYIYRYELHPDFAYWRRAVLDAFCRSFDSDALILAQTHTLKLSDAQYESLGFVELPPRSSTIFRLRQNALKSMRLEEYPEDAPPATREHAAWLEANGKWSELC